MATTTTRRGTLTGTCGKTTRKSLKVVCSDARRNFLSSTQRPGWCSSVSLLKCSSRECTVQTRSWLCGAIHTFPSNCVDENKNVQSFYLSLDWWSTYNLAVCLLARCLIKDTKRINDNKVGEKCPCTRRDYEWLVAESQMLSIDHVNSTSTAACLSACSYTVVVNEFYVTVRS